MFVISLRFFKGLPLSMQIGQCAGETDDMYPFVLY